MPLEFRQGDTAEPIQGFLEEEDGTPLPNLSGAVVYAHLKAEDGTKLIDMRKSIIWVIYLMTNWFEGCRRLRQLYKQV